MGHASSRPREPFGVNVADFLELQGPFQGDGIVESAAQEEPVLPVHVRPAISRIWLDCSRIVLIFSGICASSSMHQGGLAAADVAPAPQLDGQHAQHRTWAVKALVLATPISGPDVQIDARIGRPGDGGAHDIDDAQDGGPPLLGLLDGGERVGRLARLADSDHDGPVADDRIAVAELTGVFRLGGDAGQVLEQKLPTRPAWNAVPQAVKMMCLACVRSRRWSDDAPQHDLAAPLVEPSAQAGAQRTGAARRSP